jgi:geranylgeranyl diphosphate synthase type II
MYQAEELQIIVNDTIKKIDFGTDPVELYSPIEYALSGGGKRIRPLLTLMACNLFSDDIQKAISPALGMEIFHNFTLLHDDIMDKADLRRNKPTVHKKWNENVAILSGDAMMIKAYEYFFTLEPEQLAKVLPVFNKTALQVCEGQQYDMNFESRMDVNAEEYVQMITLKTAVLLACCLKVGSLIGGADNENSKYLYEFGLNLGLVFQLQDDYLDVYGDVNTFGKQIGGDIASNKKTFLLINALENAKGEVRNKLLYNLHVEPNTKTKIMEVTGIYNELGIPQNIAMNSLGKVKLPDNRKTILTQLAESLIKREH